MKRTVVCVSVMALGLVGVVGAQSRAGVAQPVSDAVRGQWETAKKNIHDSAVDVAEAVYLADRVAVMAHGRIRSDVRIDLPKARDSATRYSPRFNEICAQLRQAMDGVAA